MEVLTNQRELQMESKSVKASCIRFCKFYVRQFKYINRDLRSENKKRVTYDSLVFNKHLVVLGDGDQKDDRCDVFEAVDPFFALGTLSAHIEHAVSQIANDEGCFCDTGGFNTRPQDVLVCRHVVGVADAVD